VAALSIQSGLRHFNLLTRINRVSAEGMEAIADLHRKPPFCGLEAMAQLAALHVRHCLLFQRHAFLLKVTRGQLPRLAELRGSYSLAAERYSQSSQGFAYRVRGHRAGEQLLEADLLIGTRRYDDLFREDILEAHYRSIFNRLRQEG
jgi:hypothetical protein